MSAPSTPVSLVSERDRQILRALASRIDPNDAAAHNNLGVLYFNKRMLDEALEQFRAAIAIDRGLRVARENFVHALRALGQTEEAVKGMATTAPRSWQSGAVRRDSRRPTSSSRPSSGPRRCRADTWRIIIAG
jgi:Flp pilus assembly protein TadD